MSTRVSTKQALQCSRQILIDRPDRDYFAEHGWQLLAEETLRQVCSALGDDRAVEMIEANQRIASESANRKRLAREADSVQAWLRGGESRSYVG